MNDVLYDTFPRSRRVLLEPARSIANGTRFDANLERSKKDHLCQSSRRVGPVLRMLARCSRSAMACESEQGGAAEFGADRYSDVNVQQEARRLKP
jgi:hypothetical protein